MKLLDLLRRESTISLRNLAVMAGIAGVSNAFVLAIINVAVENATNDSHSFRHLLMFALSVTLWIVSQRHIMVASTAEIEAVLHQVRVRLADKIRHADLLPLEKIGRSRIYASISKETQTISQAAAAIVVGCQASILVFFTLLYLAWLSLTAWVLFVTGISFALVVYFRKAKAFNRQLHESMARENVLFESLTHMLDGFKEVKMNSERSDDLFDHVGEISASVAELKVKTQTGMSLQFIFSQSVFYLLLAAIVFVVPRLSETYNEIIVKAVTAILFIISPISNVVSSVPLFATANAASENIFALEKLLDESVDRSVASDADFPSFEEIRFEGVVFQFHDPHTTRSFTLGPIELTIPAGQILFVAGGNGSGKSTFLRLLTALYYPQKGVIRVDGIGLSAANYQAYRRLFSVVFSDYHLFDRLFGLRNLDEARVETLLEQTELDRKTSYADGRFTTLDLSTGQRKRLALVVSLLEDKPIYVFDEWAAEQDPVFRKRFYEKILVGLKKRGKTVIAVTHDDRYYHLADRLLKMEEGSFVDLERA